MRPVLITECLQRDFVDPIGPYEPLPNQLHVGHTEATRLLGPDPSVGPLAQLMNFVNDLADEDIQVIHIRDWHDPHDLPQTDHLATFGEHCLRDTPGARLVLDMDRIAEERSNHCIVDSLTLNDFEGTSLQSRIEDILATSRDGLRVGVVGVWTEAKVSFLLYELKTRLGIDRLATCSALTASASRTQHFNALEQLSRILGVQVFDSVAEFAEWLRPGAVLHVPGPRGGIEPRIEVEGEANVLGPAERTIVSHLFRESSLVRLTPLSGGYSGALVFSATSEDVLGHHHAPSVLKIGPNLDIAQERVSFERVEEVLGNSAPSVRGFVDLGNRAGLRYSYAAMGRSGVRTLKALFERNEPLELIETVLRTALEEVLGPLYSAARYERLPVFREYEFSTKWAVPVERQVTDLLAAVGGSRSDGVVTLPGHQQAPDVVPFYQDFLTGPLPESDYHYVSYVHGDLNAANILVDGRDNVWVIDFFHTAPGHVLMDLAKLENDLLYILTPLHADAELGDALSLSRALLEVADLAAPLQETPPSSTTAALRRAWQILRLIREIGGRLCREDRNPLQYEVALLRYAVHTLRFEESSDRQRCWALGAAGMLAERIEARVRADRRLRVDWLDGTLTGPGRLGITICPGRRDRGRDLDEDLVTLRDDGVTRLLCLLPDAELRWAGVPDLLDRAARSGLSVHHLPVPDQAAPGFDDAREVVAWCEKGVNAGDSVAVTCMGGLGRSGTVAACFLVARGFDAPRAISAIRRTRDPRAVETAGQEAFVAAFAERLSS